MKKYSPFENCHDSCIALFSSVLVFIIPHSTRAINTSGHIPGIADTQSKHTEIRHKNTFKQVHDMYKSKCTLVAAHNYLESNHKGSMALEACLLSICQNCRMSHCRY